MSLRPLKLSWREIFLVVKFDQQQNFNLRINQCGYTIHRRLDWGALNSPQKVIAYQQSEYSLTKRNESKGVSKRHSLCFLLSGLPFPAFSLFILTSAKPQVQHLASMSDDTSLKMPSLSEDELAITSFVYFTYIALSLNRSSSSGIRITRSTPGDETL